MSRTKGNDAGPKPVEGRTPRRRPVLPKIGTRVRVQFGPRLVDAVVTEHRSNGRIGVRFDIAGVEDQGTSSYLPEEIHQPD